jgi:hypothetical protein
VFARAVGKNRSYRVGALRDLLQRLAEPVIVGRQGVAQRAVKPRPAAHGSLRRLGNDGFAGAVEADDFGHADAHRLVEGNAGALQDANELWMRAEPDTGARQLFGVALEDHGVPADLAQEMRCD